MKRSEVYKVIRDVVKEKMPYLQYVDLQKQQMKRPSEHYPIALPALLVEFKDARFSNISQLNQIGDFVISIYLYLDLVTDSFDGSELESETIELLDKADDVFQTLQGVSCDLFSQLIRIGEAVHEYGNKYICLRTDFATSIKEEKEKVKIVIERPKIKITTHA